MPAVWKDRPALGRRGPRNQDTTHLSVAAATHRRYKKGERYESTHCEARPTMSEPADELVGRRGEGDPLLDRVERAEAMYHSLVDSLPGVTYSESLDDANTLSISPQIQELLGYTQEEWTGNPHLWVEVLHPDDQEWVVASCHEANESAASWRAEYRMVARDGRVVWVRDIATLVRGSQGQGLCWQGVMIDITSLKDGAS
jgi:PAS domain S-box-containing protein